GIQGSSSAIRRPASIPSVGVPLDSGKIVHKINKSSSNISVIAELLGIQETASGEPRLSSPGSDLTGFAGGWIHAGGWRHEIKGSCVEVAIEIFPDIPTWVGRGAEEGAERFSGFLGGYI